MGVKISAKLTTKIYDCAKVMLENGGHPQDIADYLHVSRTTVNRISRTETFEDYKKMQMGYKTERKTEKKPEKILAKKPESKPEQTSMIVTADDLCGLIREQNEILTLMCEKLAWIVDALK